jgi:conjugal transfer pilus assembly protein TraI
MFSWLKKKPVQIPRTQAIEPIHQWSDEEIPRYPPFMKGLPSVPPEKLLETQAELLARLSDTAITTPQAFARFYVPAIGRFASFVHLLPASQSHHHRGAGGLLRHSLEVGLWALQAADRVLLDATPSQRREMEPRWQFAVFAAALCHDAGKPVTDLVVTNRDRTTIWKPIKEDLHDWAAQNRVDAYFLDWREGRSRQHTALANLIADRIIGAEALEWIEEGGTDLLVWLQESLNCNPGPANPIHDLVIKADQASVERDLKSLGAAMAGYDLGVPVERHLTDIMRRLVKEGKWRVNEPGARLWNLEGHLYLVWPAAGEEIARQVREDGIPGIPRTPDGILDMLVERRIAFVRDGAAPGERFWKIAPVSLSEKLPDLTLPAIRLRDDTLVSSTPIPPVDGRIVGGEDIGEMTVPEEVVSGRSTDSSGDAGQEPTSRCDARIVVADDPPTPELSVASEPEDSSVSTVLEPMPATCVAQAEKHREPETRLDGAIGEALKAIVQDLASGDKRVGEEVLVDAAGHVLLRWPDAFSGYGLTAKGILDELSEREWLWIDPMAPLRKVLDGQMGGAPAKVIRLEREISEVLIRALGDATGAGAPVGDAPPDLAPAPRADASPDNEEARDYPSSARCPAPESGQDRPTSKSRSKGREGHPPIVKDSMIVQQTLTPDPEGAKRGAPADASRPGLPTLEDVLAVLEELPVTQQADGWRSMPKREAIAACRKHGMRLTHGHLDNLAQQDTDRFALDGVILRYKARTP